MCQYCNPPHFVQLTSSISPTPILKFSLFVPSERCERGSVARLSGERERCQHRLSGQCHGRSDGSDAGLNWHESYFPNSPTAWTGWCDRVRAFVTVAALLGSAMSAEAQVIGNHTAPREMKSTPELMRWPETHVPGLDRIVAEGLARSPVAMENELRQLAAEATRDSAAAAVLPRVHARWDGYGRQEERRDRAGSQSGFKQWYDVSVEQPLYHWGALTNQKRLGEIRRAIAQGEIREARRKLVEELRRAYAELITRRLELGVLHRRLDLARGALAEMDASEREFIVR